MTISRKKINPYCGGDVFTSPNSISHYLKVVQHPKYHVQTIILLVMDMFFKNPFHKLYKHEVHLNFVQPKWGHQ
jgi:hypothetical protein